MRLLCVLVIWCGGLFPARAAEPADETPRGPLAADKEVPEGHDAVAADAAMAAATNSAPLVSIFGHDPGLLWACDAGTSFATLRAQAATRLAARAPEGAKWLADPSALRDALRVRTLDFLGLHECQSLLPQPNGGKFLGWLFNHGDLMQEVAGSFPTGPAHQTAPKGTVALWLKLWSEQAPEEREACRRLAAGLALAHAHPVKAVGGGVIDPLARYRWYRDADRAGRLLPYFHHASVPELANITGVARTDEDLAWAHEKVSAKKRNMSGCGYSIKYRKFNDAGVSVQKGSVFYEGKPTTFPVLAEYGGVCGAISRINTDVRRAYGLPSFTVGQPGHCAYITKTAPTEWRIKNNISGWTKTTHADRFEPWGSNGDFMRIFNEVTRDVHALRRAELLITAADATPDKAAKRICLDAALAIVPRHFGAWEKLAALPPDDVEALKARAAQVFASYAAPLDELTKEFDAGGKLSRKQGKSKKKK